MKASCKSSDGSRRNSFPPPQSLLEVFIFRQRNQFSGQVPVTEEPERVGHSGRGGGAELYMAWSWTRLCSGP